MQSLPQIVIIYGTGLIGGSIALALRRAGVRVFGVDQPDVLKRASRLGMIEEGTPPKADLVILAAPVGEILKLIDRMPINDVLITDVGSTKVEICRRAEQRSLSFIGGHPMAGLEQSGPEAASADLFKDAPYFLCPCSSTPENAVATMYDLANVLGAIPQLMPPIEHDKLVAKLSHLPQIISTMLADYTDGERNFAGSGLRSMTRLARSPFHVWHDIFRTSGFLPVELRFFIERLQLILDSMEKGDLKEVEEAFRRRESR